jgi:hypothetical protein
MLYQDEKERLKSHAALSPKFRSADRGAEFRNPNDAVTILGRATVFRPNNARSRATSKANLGTDMHANRGYQRLCQARKRKGKLRFASF